MTAFVAQSEYAAYPDCGSTDPRMSGMTPLSGCAEKTLRRENTATAWRTLS